uniref:glycerol-3-phosphate dehydrogenase (NAD(+)) n=1 Tax=Macrostomum lignano TaxID=282301 RepID=A0A1I8FHP0_9PLAT
EPMPKGLSLLTDLIRSNLGMECAIAKEVYCEATLGCRDPTRAAQLKRLFQTPYFRISIIENEFSVEICGALKSIVATGAGFCDALGFGDNTKAAVIRLGFMEILRYVQRFYGSAGVTKRTLMQSCGIGDIISSCYNTKDVKWAATHDGSGPLGMHDLVTTCYGGRNRKLGEAMLEKEMLDGQRLQGPLIAAEVHRALQEEGQLQRFPLMVAVHLICSGQMKPRDFIEQLREHPEHIPPPRATCCGSPCRSCGGLLKHPQLEEGWLGKLEPLVRAVVGSDCQCCSIMGRLDSMRHSVWMLQLLLLLLWQPPCDCVSISRDKDR